MKPRLTCFDCKKRYRLARCARKDAAAASTANEASAAATTLNKKVAKKNVKGSTVAQPSAASSAASAKPSETAVGKPSLAPPQSPSTVFSIRYDLDGAGVAIREAPFYPGARTGEQISAGQIVAVSESKSISHTDTDGKSHIITFYRLADGRGWAHDFCPTTSKVTFSRVQTTSPSSSPTVASVTDTTTPSLSLSAPPSFVRYMPCHGASRLHILKTAAYPGEPTGHFIIPGAIERVTSSTVFVDTRFGQATSNTFYQLADGRGWIHDFDLYEPGMLSLTRGHFDDLNSLGKPISSYSR